MSRKSPSATPRMAIAGLIGLSGLLAGALLSQPAIAQTAAAYSAAEWAKIVAAAKSEGKVVMYSSALPSLHGRLRTDFENANPDIVLEIHRLVGANVNSTVEQERQAGTDGGNFAVVTDMLWLDRQAAGGFLKAPVGPATREWPVQYLRAGVAPLLAIEPIAIAYNTNLVKSPITGYQDLVRPGNNLRIGGTEITSTVAAAYHDWLEKTQGAEFLKTLAAQNLRIYGSNAIATQAVASGEVDITFTSNPSSALPVIAQGAPMKLVYANPSFGFMFGGGVLNGTKRQNAALVLADYLMSRRGQAIWNGLGEGASPLKDIPGALNLENTALFEPAKYPPEAVKAYTAKWNGIFKKQ